MSYAVRKGGYYLQVAGGWGSLCCARIFDDKKDATVIASLEGEWDPSGGVKTVFVDPVTGKDETP